MSRPRLLTAALAVGALGAVALIAPAAESATRAVPAAPVQGTGTPAVATLWNADRFETSAQDWTDLPGAVVPDSTGRGVGFDGVFVVHFDADAICESPVDNAVCSVRVLVGGQVAAPGDTNARFVTARGRPEWSAHGYTRTACFAPQFDGRDATTRIQVRASRDASFGLQNWHLEVERFPLRAGTACPS
ncbi:hypothetical protein GCM10010441_77020 [Kitasatospora paracochleata]|uniref:Uncharacterized protein n=1 Tax=Kitasatospora paracochleata TaxID=58354 RepID=A0ABT1IRC0_9ACTN|nr:hypothetical protein [Kitasatospora paracochleata]MCP2307650.1 hypothetical protein [Kitasatospora paracochleata]